MEVGGGINSLPPTVTSIGKGQEEKGGGGVVGGEQQCAVTLQWCSWGGGGAVHGAAARWGERLQMKQGHSCTET